MSSSPSSESASPTVLIIEDETGLADLYAAWLDDAYSILTATTGEEAYANLTEAIDVAILDRRIPDVSGDEILTSIRDENMDIRVVVVSAVSPDVNVIGLGFDDYLVKPITSEELRSAVDRMLARSTYHGTVKELWQLRSAKETLESEMQPERLAEHDEYLELVDRIAALEADAYESLEDFEIEDYQAAFRDLNEESPAR